MSSAHPQHPAGAGGGNPDYYAETSSTAGAPPAELSGGTPPSSHQPGVYQNTAGQDRPPQYQEQVYPPPPPGPPPSGHQHQQHQQDHYPPPPPGPPPNQTQAYHPLQSHPTHGEELPGYTETPGLHVPGDEKPPPLPGRPGSRPGSSHSQGGTPYFAPPPGPSSDQSQAPYYPPPPGGVGTSSQQGHGSHSAAAAASSSGSAVGEHATDAKKKKGFGERFYDWSVKAGVPINKVTNKLGSEAFWPTSMDKECDKAARILKSFCKDGFYTTTSNHPPPSPGHATNPGPNQSSKTLVKIPSKALSQAKGLAIFTVFRTGLHISGASGSGIVLARGADGISWSPPSGFLVHTLGAGFMVGLDIYDCVCVLNTDEAVRAFTRPRLSLGGEIAVVAGPVGAGAAVDAALGASSKPVWSYMKSRGFYAGVQADGTVIVQRPDANAAFYGDKVTPEQILKGQVPNRATPAAAGTGTASEGVVMWPQGAVQLMEVLKSAEGKKADERVVEEVGAGPTPGDLAGTGGVARESEKEKEALGGGKGSVRYS